MASRSSGVDTSALLRLVLREPGALTDLRAYAAPVSSELIAVESLRTVDRLRLQGLLTMEEGGQTRPFRSGLEPVERPRDELKALQHDIRSVIMMSCSGHKFS